MNLETRRRNDDGANDWRPFALACFLLLGFSGLALIVSGDNELEADVRLLRWLQSRSWPVLDPLGDATNWLFDGTPLTVGIVIGFVICVRSGLRTEALVLGIIAIVRPLNGLLKRLIDSPRPGTEFIRESEVPSSLGFPSGHTAGAVLVCGFVAWAIARSTDQMWVRILVWLIALVVIGTTGFGRMWVGAHWPSDVLGGLIWASVALILIIVFVPNMARNRSQ